MVIKNCSQKGCTFVGAYYPVLQLHADPQRYGPSQCATLEMELPLCSGHKKTFDPVEMVNAFSEDHRNGLSATAFRGRAPVQWERTTVQFTTAPVIHRFKERKGS